MYDSGSDDVIGDFDGKAFNIESGPHTYVEGEFFAAQVVENILRVTTVEFKSDGPQLKHLTCRLI